MEEWQGVGRGLCAVPTSLEKRNKREDRKIGASEENKEIDMKREEAEGKSEMLCNKAT
jgi:hypothetical protein